MVCPSMPAPEMIKVTVPVMPVGLLPFSNTEAVSGYCLPVIFSVFVFVPVVSVA